MVRSTISPAGLLMLATALTLTACGDSNPYSGTWKRDLYNEGEVEMNLSSGGDLKLMLPSPRWPDPVDVEVKGAFRADTLVLQADTVKMKCQSAEARYVLAREGDALRVSGVGMDSCGGRRAALVGSWKKS